MAKAKTLDEIFDLVKQKIINNNLSINELSINIDCEEPILEILLNSNKDFVGILSRLIDLTGVKLKAKEGNFKVYEIYDNGSQIKVRRKLKPYCSVYFNKATGDFYDFSMKYKLEKISETSTNIILSEMAEAVKKYVDS